jgi:hypothetical protein
VLEPAGGDGLAPEALERPAAVEVALVEDLQGDLPIQVELGRPVDDRLPAAADLGLDAVAAELLARYEPQSRPPCEW